MKTLLLIIAIIGIFVLVFSFTSCTKEVIQPELTTPAQIIIGHTYQFGSEQVKFLGNGQGTITPANVVTSYTIKGDIDNFELKIALDTTSVQLTTFQGCKLLYNKDILTSAGTFKILQ
jgi:uncharacterized lipoprotein YehR (DUF1307 family)